MAMKIYAYWWGIQLVPDNDEDQKAIEIIEKSEYVRGYDTQAGDKGAIQRVNPSNAEGLDVDRGLIINR